MERFDAAGFMALIGYEFKDGDLLLGALTHTSWMNEHPLSGDNERLEFIGDAVLGFVIAEELYRRYADWDEGKLTVAKSALVSRESLGEIASGLGIVSFMRLGTGEKRPGDPPSTSVGADALEAVIGAVFLDGGIAEAARMVGRLLGPKLDCFHREGVALDPKGALQALCHERFGASPSYKVEREDGPDHNKRYLCSVTASDGRSAAGEGRSKKEAQKNAAAALLALLSGFPRKK